MQKDGCCLQRCVPVDGCVAEEGCLSVDEVCLLRMYVRAGYVVGKDHLWRWRVHLSLGHTDSDHMVRVLRWAQLALYCLTLWTSSQVVSCVNVCGVTQESPALVGVPSLLDCRKVIKTGMFLICRSLAAMRECVLQNTVPISAPCNVIHMQALWGHLCRTAIMTSANASPRKDTRTLWPELTYSPCSPVPCCPCPMGIPCLFMMAVAEEPQHILLCKCIETFSPGLALQNHYRNTIVRKCTLDVNSGKSPYTWDIFMDNFTERTVGKLRNLISRGIFFFFFFLVTEDGVSMWMIFRNLFWVSTRKYLILSQF